jgi:hypothetical protein
VLNSPNSAFRIFFLTRAINTSPWIVLILKQKFGNKVFRPTALRTVSCSSIVENSYAVARPSAARVNRKIVAMLTA